MFALAEVSALGFAVFRLIQGEHVVIAAWSAAFLSLGTGYVLAFLVGMERYERRPVTPWHANLSPDELYRRITDQERVPA